MNINFKGVYFLITKSDQWVHGQCPVSPWTQWTLSSPPGSPGLCPGCPWSMSRLSSESMDNVHWIHDIVQSGRCHWTLSIDSLDFVQTVHWVHGKYPLSPWTMSKESTESMDFLQMDWLDCYNSLPKVFGHFGPITTSSPSHFGP